jgi:predicted small metal-binding protein
MNNKKTQADAPNPGNNPNVQSSEGGINPSAPSTGTSGWGTTPDEKLEQVSQNNPTASSPNAKGAGDTRHTSYPQNEAAQNPVVQQETGSNRDRSFHCAEQDCDWSVTGSTEEEILGYMRAHAREAHAKNEFTPKELASARRSIHKNAA